MNRRALLLLAAAGVVAPVGLSWRSTARPLPPSGARYFTNAPLTAHDGRRLRFYDDLLKGKNVIIDFMSADCAETCPGMTQNLVAVQALLGDRVGRDVFMYSITLEPERDTPEVLSDYARAYGVKPGWLFLTGARADIEMLRRRLAFHDGDDGALPQLGAVRIGAEPLHRWGVAPARLQPCAMLRAINRVLPPE
jgi:protein SCO1/2